MNTLSIILVGLVSLCKLLLFAAGIIGVVCILTVFCILPAFLADSLQASGYYYLYSIHGCIVLYLGGLYTIWVRENDL